MGDVVGDGADVGDDEDAVVLSEWCQLKAVEDSKKFCEEALTLIT